MLQTVSETLRVSLDTEFLPDIRLREGVPEALATTSIPVLFSSVIPQTTASVPSATPPKSISTMFPPGTTLPLNGSNLPGSMEGSCGVSAGEAVGFTFLTIAEVLGIYEISSLIAFMVNHWGHTAAQIPKYWDYITLGVVYGLKRWGPIAAGVSDEMVLTEEGAN